MEIERQNLRKYLLGDLPGKLSEELDLQIISDASLEDDLGWAEDDLIEDYLDELLSPAEIELFDRNFLTSDERREQLRLTKLIKTYARQTADGAASDQISSTKTRSLRDRLSSFLELGLQHPLPALCGLLVLGLLVGLSWRFLFYAPLSGDSDRMQREVLQLNSRDLSDLTAFEHLSTVSLIGGTLRDSSPARQLNANSLTETVLFHLALPASSAPPGSFQVKIRKDGQEPFLSLQAHSYSNQSAQEIRLLLPSSQLKPGSYEIDVFRENSQVPLTTFPFSVR